jgi:hypothetical protein
MKSWRQTDFRRSRLHGLISNPRFSTFRQLTPTATAFHDAPRAPHVTSSLYERHIDRPSERPELARTQHAYEADDISEKSQVTIHYTNVGTPRLDFRLSALGDDLESQNRHRMQSDSFDPPPPVSVWSTDSSPKTFLKSGTISRIPSAAPSQAVSMLSALIMTDSGHETYLKGFSSPASTPLLPPPTRKQSTHFSSKSVDSSFSAVRDLAPQFPTLSNVLRPPTNVSVPGDFWDDTISVNSPGSSTEERGKSKRVINPGRDEPSQESQELSVKPLPTQLRAPQSRGVSFLNVDDSDLSRSNSSPSRRSPQGPASEDNKSAQRKSILKNHGDQGGQLRVQGSDTNMATYRVSWAQEAEIIGTERQAARDTIQRPAPARIKSVGSAPLRSSPSLTSNEHTRGSMHLEHIMVPPHRSNTHAVQGSVDSGDREGILSDTEAMAIEGAAIVNR